MVNLTYNAFQKRPKTPKNKNTAPSLSAEKKFKVFKKFKSVFKKKGYEDLDPEGWAWRRGVQSWAVVAAQATCGGAFLRGLLTQVPAE